MRCVQSSRLLLHASCCVSCTHRLSVCTPTPGQVMVDAGAPSHQVMHMVNRDSSVEAEDIFNNMHRVIITNVDNDMWEQINQVNLPAHNVNPGAPEHLSMVNTICFRTMPTTSECNREQI